ncbi:Vegetative incompatibility protein HET-E-1 [Colletotrichum tropicale]|nr:Vegetative incompatibility protein HET-E-1 [Colletotrichum tropicale]
MDPVSAFGLAVNVLAVVDFSKTFLEAFKELVEECQNLSKELIHLAEELSVKGSSKLITKVKATTRTVWSHGKIQEKKTRLEAIRGQLLFDIVVPMAIKVTKIPDTAAMDTQTRILLDEIKAGEDANSAIEKRLHAFHEEYATLQAERHTEIVSILNEIRGSTPQPVTFTTRTRNEKPKEQILGDLLDSLYFPQQGDRLYDIKPAHKGTFEWIYSEPRSGATKATWANFQTWLQHDSGIYWVSGKAGSGKSTLMKMVSNDERTRHHLLEWSAGSRLLVLSFYFWNPGTPLQKSLEGLLRSIISQALEKFPELAEKLFPDRFERRMDNHNSPTMQEVERAFAHLMSPGLTDVSHTPIKLVLLIDGLDEFDAGSMSLTDLSALFTAASLSTSFKAVLSSRPENAFEEAFVNCPKLRLHFLTHDDIVKYVNENLYNHPRMVQLAIQAPKESYNLIEEIVEAAQGVFLWVRLVLRSLLEGFQNHDAIDTLTERLRELPSDLENLFRVMLERVPQRYKQAMSKAFQLMRIAAEIQYRAKKQDKSMMMCEVRPLTALGLKFALLDAKTVLQAESSQILVERASEEIHSVAAQIRVSCSGLIELRNYSGYAPSDLPLESEVITRAGKGISSAIANDLDDPETHFIHRSVTEYLFKEDVWDLILTQAEKDFQAWAALLQSLVMQAKKCPYRAHEKHYNKSPWDMVSTAFEIARTMEQEHGTDQLDMLNALETALNTRCGLEWWDTYQEDYKRPVKWHDDFFAITVRYGLRHYVQSRLRSSRQRSIHKPGRPLLDYACGSEPAYQVWSRASDARIVKALLQHGADPNKLFNEFSPWQNAWYAVWFGRGLRHKIVPILEVLLANGADPNAYIEFSKRLAKRVWQDRRLSVLLVALKFRSKLWKMRHGVRINDDDDDENVDEGQEEDDDNDDEDHDTSDEATCIYQGILRLIKELRKKGARSREWRKVDGAFILQGSSSWIARRRTLQARFNCVLL